MKRYIYNSKDVKASEKEKDWYVVDIDLDKKNKEWWAKEEKKRKARELADEDDYYDLTHEEGEYAIEGKTKSSF